MKIQMQIVFGDVIGISVSSGTAFGFHLIFDFISYFLQMRRTRLSFTLFSGKIDVMRMMRFAYLGLYCNFCLLDSEWCDKVRELENELCMQIWRAPR